MLAVPVGGIWQSRGAMSSPVCCLGLPNPRPARLALPAQRRDLAIPQSGGWCQRRRSWAAVPFGAQLLLIFQRVNVAPTPGTMGGRKARPYHQISGLTRSQSGSLRLADVPSSNSTVSFVMRLIHLPVRQESVSARSMPS